MVQAGAVTRAKDASTVGRNLTFIAHLPCRRVRPTSVDRPSHVALSSWQHGGCQTGIDGGNGRPPRYFQGTAEKTTDLDARARLGKNVWDGQCLHAMRFALSPGFTTQQVRQWRSRSPPPIPTRA